MPALSNEVGAGEKTSTDAQEHDLGCVASPSQILEDVCLTPTEAAKLYFSAWAPSLIFAVTLALFLLHSM